MSKVVLIGMGDGFMDAPEYGSCELWGITSVLLWRWVNLTVDMNDHSGLRWGKSRKLLNDKVIAKSKEFNIPYIGLKEYPIDEIIEAFNTDFFSNTVDYAIALAVYRGFTEIDLHGVTLDGSGEYLKYQPGVNFWCGVAKGRGIKLTVYGKNTTVMRTEEGLLYGYDRPQKGRL